MSRYEETQERNPSSKGPHPDYDYNLMVARNFIAKVETQLPNGMKVAITGSHGIEKSLLMISWHPPMEAKIGNWANPIFLHQNRQDFGKQLEITFNGYMKKVEMFNNGKS